ncbi:hypothetical protein [Anaeromyxobacter oryzae]|uniref:Uncharacterized protein n=1 Tax=Anaeromyxobacter oryzae TaxID=2918170 RepID=A0ABN6MQ03_9BACT|nr:hypothetical protein [Anaeromyxobacter oryzae]BDG02017.1 hypothetical protein AMOR_10130 [Anaeromyxobacter oryzae]
MSERGDALTVVTRLARPHVLAVLAAVLLVPAGFAAAGRRPVLAAALAGAAVALVGLGGRSTRAWLGAGRVTVEPASPFERRASRALDEFVKATVETVGEARVRSAEARARSFEARSGASLPEWARASAGPGTNDHLRRIVLVPRAGEPLPVTAWLAPEDDLEPARRAVEARLR